MYPSRKTGTPLHTDSGSRDELGLLLRRGLRCRDLPEVTVIRS